MTPEMLEHEAYPPGAAAAELKAGLVRTAATPVELLGGLHIHRGDEAQAPSRARPHVFGPALKMLGRQIRFAVQNITAATVETPPLPFIRCKKLHVLIAQIDPVDSRTAQNEFIAQMRALMIDAQQIRPGAPAVTERQSDPVIRVDQIARRGVEIEQREHPALNPDLRAASASQKS